jgi:hypothetical protein
MNIQVRVRELFVLRHVGGVLLISVGTHRHLSVVTRWGEVLAVKWTAKGAA